MPPYPKDRTIWHGTYREVRKEQDEQGKWSVLVSFKRGGYKTDTQERIEEVTETILIDGKLSRARATMLEAAVSAACDASYSQGYSAARKGP